VGHGCTYGFENVTPPREHDPVAGYRLEQRLPRHCRVWTSDDPDRDTWHDCLIWVHTT
jgi:hypothetical protein